MVCDCSWLTKEGINPPAIRRSVTDEFRADSGVGTSVRQRLNAQRQFLPEAQLSVMTIGSLSTAIFAISVLQRGHSSGSTSPMRLISSRHPPQEDLTPRGMWFHRGRSSAAFHVRSPSARSIALCRDHGWAAGSSAASPRSACVQSLRAAGSSVPSGIAGGRPARRRCNR